MLFPPQIERLEHMMRHQYRAAFAASATYEDFCTAVGRIEPDYAWWLRHTNKHFGHCFLIEKNFPGNSFLRQLVMPTARSLPDVFSSCRLLTAPDGVHDVLFERPIDVSGDATARLDDGSAGLRFYCALRDGVREKIAPFMYEPFDNRVEAVRHENGLLLVARGPKRAEAWIALIPDLPSLNDILSKKRAALFDEMLANTPRPQTV